MQLYGVYGILATPIYGSDRSGTIYGRVPSFLNISHQLRFEDISWGHLVGTSRGDISWGHLVGTLYHVDFMKSGLRGLKFHEILFHLKFQSARTSIGTTTTTTDNGGFALPTTAVSHDYRDFVTGLVGPGHLIDLFPEHKLHASLSQSVTSLSQ